MANLDGAALAEPRLIRFTTGMRKQAWNRNVVAIGLSGGFMEPLESTSLHLIQSAISRLIDLFPDRGFDPVTIAQYNRQTRFEYERIRDFIILHYKLNQRTDAPFWRQCAAMAVPDTLTEKMALFRAHGRVVRVDNELFSESGWVQVMLGQNLMPAAYSPLVDAASDAELADLIGGVGEVVQKCVAVMPEHAAYIRQFCASPRG